MLQTIYEPADSSLQQSVSLTVLGEEETSGGVQARENTYNVWNQLTGVKDGSTTAVYTYGPDGLRQSKTVNGQTTTHIWDGEELAAELDTEGAMTARYLQGNTLAASLDHSGTFQYYLYNGHGDVTGLANGSGTVTKSYTYDAFGNETNPDQGDSNPFRYCGEYFDKETGSIYLRARYYDPAAGRFGTEDPVKDGVNWYAYCGNNPVNFWDPSGNAAETILDIGSAAYSIYIFKEDPSLKNGLYALWDGVSIFVPGIPGSYVIKSGGKVANVVVKKANKFTRIEIFQGKTKHVNKVSIGSINQLSAKAKTMFSKYEKAGWKGNVSGQTPGTRAGERYRNDGTKDSALLPEFDKNKNKITYRAFDVNNKIPRKGRDGERFVKGSDGSVYYTNDHYKSFTKVK